MKGAVELTASPIKVSVVVPVYNAQKTIAACVNGLLIQNAPGIDMEIILVDDGSTDATAEILKTFDRIRYFYQPNAGPAAARNHGAHQASGDIVFFTDSDCIPRPDWVAKMINGFRCERAGAVAGSYGIANPESLLARCIHQEILFRHECLMGDWVDVFGSYNAAVIKEVFERAGGFNTSYRFPSGEDNELSYRLRRNGVRIRFIKDARVDHAHPVSVRRYLYEQFRHGVWRVKMYRAFPAMMAGDGYTFWKDPFEIVLSFGAAGLLVMGLFFSAWYLGAVFVLAAVWFFFEFVFAWKMGLRGFHEQAVFAAVMILRAGARAAGFCCGFFSSRPQHK
jgi:glycosyltransferase involved in cell wall biosynthesis